MAQKVTVRILEHTDQCKECEPIEPNDLSAGERFMRNLTRYILFGMDYDVFAIYKGTHHHQGAKYGIYMRAELRIPLGYNDYLREKWRKLKRFLIAYLALKQGLSIVIQIATYSRIHAQQEHKFGLANQPQDDKLEDFNLVDFLLNLGDVIGNPLAGLTALSLVFSSLIMLSMLYSPGYMAYKFTKVPLNAANLRLYLSPLRELRRIDMVIRQRIEYMMANLNMCRSGEPRHRPIKGKLSPLDGEPQTEFRARLPQQQPHEQTGLFFLKPALQQPPLAAPVVLPLSVCSMRPSVYSRKLYQSIHRASKNIVLCVFLIVVPLTAFVLYQILLNAITSLCDIRSVAADSCTALTVLTAQDIFVLFELLVGIILSGYILIAQVIIIACNIWAQYDSCYGIRGDFLESLRILRTTNRRSQGLEEVCPKRFAHGADLSDFQNYPHLLRDKVRVDTVLFKTLIKVTLTEEDLRSNSLFITLLVESVLCVLASTILMMILAEKLKGVDVKQLRQAILAASLLAANAILLSAANFYSNISKLEKFGWSILAELSRRSQSLPHLSNGRTDLVSVYWRKLIQSYGLADKKNSIAPFGISVTHNVALQFNFFVISLFSILKSF